MSRQTDRWPYLSPARRGWYRIPGIRGDIRGLIARRVTPRPDSGDVVPVVLSALEELSCVDEALRIESLLLITEAYLRGASWADLARCLGRTKQSVHQRYQGRIHAPRTREYLLEDLRQVERWAREVTPGSVDRAAVRESVDFLRDPGR